MPGLFGGIYPALDAGPFGAMPKGGIEAGGSAAKTVTEAECRSNSWQKAPIKAKGGIESSSQEEFND